jgi:hypothetical protein
MQQQAILQPVVQQPATGRPSLWALLPTMLLSLCLGYLPAQATVLLEFSFEELVAESAFIFAGRVISQREEVQGEQRYTLISFAVDEAVKGTAPNAQIELRFLGGDPDDGGMQVEGQFMPAPGTRGVFFVNSLTQRQVNPLTGWQQGYFPLMADASGTDYLDMRQRPDLTIPGLEQDPLVSKMLGMGFSTDAIDAKVPRAFLFSWADFRAAILDETKRAMVVP